MGLTAPQIREGAVAELCMVEANGGALRIVLASLLLEVAAIGLDATKAGFSVDMAPFAVRAVGVMKLTAPPRYEEP